jgi:hypothetical protein
VSCDSVIYGWPWDERQDHESAQGEKSSLYLWRIGNSGTKDCLAETS